MAMFLTHTRAREKSKVKYDNYMNVDLSKPTDRWFEELDNTQKINLAIDYTNLIPFNTAIFVSMTENKID